MIVFSPHPDDDVISMGGTLKRLADQKHDVHVAYETSGNIAVGDEDMMRYIMLIDNIAKKFKFDTPELLKKSNEIHKFIGKKKDGESDTPDIRFIKTMIRQGEARTACNYIGIKPQNVHFLNLPFYETGTIKKGDLSEADIQIVKDLIESVKPHQIFRCRRFGRPARYSQSLSRCRSRRYRRNQGRRLDERLPHLDVPWRMGRMGNRPYRNGRSS